MVSVDMRTRLDADVVVIDPVTFVVDELPELLRRNGEPLDLSRHFTPDDSDTEMAHFLGLGARERLPQREPDPGRPPALSG